MYSMGKEKIIIGKSSGHEYKIDKEIGRGAQGRVFSIIGGKHAFKLIGKKTSLNAQLLQRKISYIKTRPIKDLPVSIPLEQVEGNALGYIMEMATDMFPIESLINKDPEKDLKSWWYQTGGLKKRLIVLKKIAEFLATLHSRGLVYGDFSLNNIFVSEDKDYNEIFFIDADNITHDSKVGTAVYTPGYGAPEIIKTETQPATSGYDTFTDDFSFAIIAYQLLTLNHPFIGDYVNEGEPELEEKAYLGKVPWVNHSQENINNTKCGIPASLTISKKMMNAFQQTFENGIAQKEKRTSTLKWSELLSGALNALIECNKESCQQNFFYSKSLLCPFCSESTEYVGIARIHPLIKKIKDEVKYEFSVNLEDIKNVGVPLSTKILSPNEYLVFTENDFLLNSSNKQLFKIKLQRDYLHIEGIMFKHVSIISNAKYKKNIDITNYIKVNLTDDLTLFFDEVNKYQRILKLKKYSA